MLFDGVVEGIRDVGSRVNERTIKVKEYGLERHAVLYRKSLQSARACRRLKRKLLRADCAKICKDIFKRGSRSCGYWMPFWKARSSRRSGSCEIHL